jgi:hypothetical protein
MGRPGSKRNVAWSGAYESVVHGYIDVIVMGGIIVGPQPFQHCYFSFSKLACSNLLGFAFLGLAASKLTTLYSGKEGTYLRRNLLLAFGVVDIVLSTSMLRFERGFQVAGSSIKYFSLLHFVEGAVFLYDAIFRPRPLKPSTKVSKGQ